MTDLYKNLARESLRKNPKYWQFSGTAHDYARASMYFHALVSRTSISRLMEVYELMVEKRMNFFTAVEHRVGWNKQRFDSEVTKFLSR